MLFEEFFKKKKINLVTFEQGEPELFSEFKFHFEQMGEKSFDHTKKYWFNKLRQRFPAPQEVKVEKASVENPLAEQTIAATLTEAAPSSNVGFKPKFRAGVTKPIDPETPAPKENTENAAPAPNIGFKPKFRAGVTKPADPETPAPKEDTEPAAPAPNIGFKPKFRAGITKPAEPAADTVPAAEKPQENTEASPAPALGFKPKFKAGVTKTVTPAPEQKEEPKAEEQPPPEAPAEDTAAKPAYKPRFNMKNIKPKEEE